MSLSSRKICILTSVHPPFDVRIFHKEAKTLLKAGYEVVLIAPHARDEIVEKIKIRAVSKPRNRIERILLASLRIFRKALKEKADIYHFHDPELILIGLLLKIFRKKIIYDVHENVPKQILSKHWIPKVCRKTLSVLFSWLEKSISKRFDYIITATPDIKKNFRIHNVKVIKNYPIVAFDSAIDKKHKQFDNNECILISIGALSLERGIIEIIQSLKYINLKNKVKLELLGWFSEKEFEIQIRDLIERSNVEYFNRVPYGQIAEHLFKAAIGLVCFHPIPNHINALPNKLFEYMSAALPVIASDFPLWREIVNGNNCGLTVNPLNPKEIAKAVEYLMLHPNEAEKMGENGRKAVLEKYNWENESKKLLKVYEELAIK